MSTATIASPFEVEATNAGGGSGELPSEGNHSAVLVGLIDLGTHTDEYQGKELKNRKVLFCWELPGEVKADGSPHVVLADYNAPPKISGKSKLRSLIESWRGRPMQDGEKLDMARMLGAACLINLGVGESKKGNKFAKILNVTPIPKGMPAPRPFNTPFSWAFGAGPFEAPDWLPYLYARPVEDHQKEAAEAGYKGPAAAGVKAPSEDNDDIIPF